MRVVIGHSKRRASIGRSARRGRRVGAEEQAGSRRAAPKARTTEYGAIAGCDAGDLELAADDADDHAEHARRAPRPAPPRSGTGRGCRARRAPIALRMPISRVRSVTLTSMMFITPIPPTSSEIAATAPSSVVKTSFARARRPRRIEPWLMTWKPGFDGSVTSWRSSRIEVTSACGGVERCRADLRLHGDRAESRRSR